RDRNVTGVQTCALPISWNREGNNTGERLRKAMAQNPNLQVFIQSGYFDGATDYFSGKYVMWNLDPSGKLQDRLHWEGYKSGHMIYMREEVLEQAANDIRSFVRQSLPEEGAPAKYK